MAIITISRGTFSGGKALAECLARKLGYRCIDRDMLVRKAATRRASEYDLRAALEEPPDFPGRFNHTRYVYLALIQAALAEQVRDGAAVYHGFAGHLLLKGAPCLLRLRIIAPMESRLEMARERLGMVRTEAIASIDRTDRDRRRWTQFLYGIDWGDPSHYDLVINLERLGIEQACRMVASAIEQGPYELTPERRAAMNDLALASRVRAELALSPYTLNLEVEVECRAGAVTLEVDAVDDGETVRRVAAAVPGVGDVTIHSTARR